VELPAALDWLDEHINLEKLTGTAGRVEGLSLEAMAELVSALGEPQRDYPVLHLTGTNGKGSTARMLSALLLAHNLSVGTYTSPHLERINERLVWNGRAVGDGELAMVLSDLAEFERVLERRPSYFELLTAAAFRWFSEIAVDAAVIEVGLLGRWDATNVADGTVAVLTNIGHDHTDGQGDWRKRIAEEKAGIVKPGSTFVLGETDPDLLQVFGSAPAAELWVRDRDFGCKSNLPAVGGRVIDVRTPNGVLPEVFVPLHGAHQGDNAAAAIAAAEAFFGRALDPAVVEEAFAGLVVPGRFEVVSRSPLVVLDGAHNPDGARAAAATLAEEFPQPGRRTLVVGMLGGRDPEEMLIALDGPIADLVVACTPDSPRAIAAGVVADAASALGIAAEIVEDPAAALVQVVERASQDELVLVTGSLYTVGQARAACRSLGLIAD
jgi:dihydrofolate synthase/folylpolyglutamate synthase